MIQIPIKPFPIIEVSTKSLSRLYPLTSKKLCKILHRQLIKFIAMLLKVATCIYISVDAARRHGSVLSENLSPFPFVNGIPTFFEINLKIDH